MYTFAVKIVSIHIIIVSNIFYTTLLHYFVNANQILRIDTKTQFKLRSDLK
jgi:hypothetical protein